MAATVATPLEKAFSAIAGIDEITSSSNTGSSNITLQFGLDRDIEVGGAGRERGDRQDAAVPAVDDPPAELPQEQPERVAGHDDRADVERPADDAGGRVRADDDRAAAVDDRRRGVGRASSARRNTRCVCSSIPKQLSARNIGVSQVANAIRQNNVMLPDGRAVRKGPDADDERDRPDEQRGGVPPADHRVSQRRGGPSRRRRERARRHPEQQVGQLLQSRAVGQSVRAAAAGHEHDGDRAAREGEARRDQAGLPPTLNVHVQYDKSITIGHSVARREGVAARRARARRSS